MFSFFFDEKDKNNKKLEVTLLCPGIHYIYVVNGFSVITM